MRVERRSAKSGEMVPVCRRITQISTKTYLLLFGRFTMFLEICTQIHSVEFAFSRQIDNQKVCENN